MAAATTSPILKMHAALTDAIHLGTRGYPAAAAAFVAEHQPTDNVRIVAQTILSLCGAMHGIGQQLAVMIVYRMRATGLLSADGAAKEVEHLARVGNTPVFALLLKSEPLTPADGLNAIKATQYGPFMAHVDGVRDGVCVGGLAYTTSETDAWWLAAFKQLDLK